MAYTLGNMCAKNCCKRTFIVHLIVENFFETMYRCAKKYLLKILHDNMK